MPEDAEPSTPNAAKSPEETSSLTSAEYPVRPNVESENHPSSPIPQLSSGLPRRPKKLLGLAVGAVVVLLLVAGFAVELHLSSTPGRVYSASLVNSGEALDKLIDYSKTQAKADYKSTSLDGTAHVGSANGSYDVSLNGDAEKGGDADLHLKIDALGEKLTADVLTNRATGNATPDVYLNVSGLNHLLDSVGLSSLDSLNGQWIVIDHTLLETYMKNLEKSTGTGALNTTNTPTYAELQDALAKVQAVNKQYLFTTDPSKAVLTNEKFIGKETNNGRTADHYRVGYNKAHLETYVAKLGGALDSSQLNSWAKDKTGKTLTEEAHFSELLKGIKNAKSDYTFDLWADTKTKLISKLTFTDPSDQSSVFALTQGYTGGSKYPFGLSVSGKDSATRSPEKFALNTTLDATTNTVSATFSSSMATSDGPVTTSGTFKVTPGDKTVHISPPPKAKSITDILLSLGLSGLASGKPQGTLQAQQGNPLVITE